MREQEFRYVYSAPTERERREIESIRAAYLPDAERRSQDGAAAPPGRPRAPLADRPPP